MLLLLHKAVVLLVHALVSRMAHWRQVAHFFLVDHVTHACTPAGDKGSFIFVLHYITWQMLPKKKKKEKRKSNKKKS